METHEIIGWIGNFFVVVQFLMSDMKKLRLYGLVDFDIMVGSRDINR